MNAESSALMSLAAGVGSPQRPVDLSIVIVSYNTRQLTCECLSSIYGSEPQMQFEVLLFDNASDDGSAEAVERLFPEVRVILSDTNVGFAAANNVAVEAALGNWVLLLNPDTQVLDKGITKLFHYAVTAEDRAIYGGSSMKPNGLVDFRSCWAAPSLWGLTMRALGISSMARHSRLLNPEEMPEWDRDSVRHVGVITGCFLMLKKSVWRELDGFDVDYFMYSEETDLCFRAHKKGIARVFYPHARVLHIGGASERSKPHKTIKLFRGKRLYFEKNFSKIASAYASLVLCIHVLLRLVAHKTLSSLDQAHTEDFMHWSIVWRDRKHWNMPQVHMNRKLEYVFSGDDGKATSCSVRDSFTN